MISRLISGNLSSSQHDELKFLDIKQETPNLRRYQPPPFQIFVWVKYVFTRQCEKENHKVGNHYNIPPIVFIFALYLLLLSNLPSGSLVIATS
jgi:hypothetical protein